MILKRVDFTIQFSLLLTLLTLFLITFGDVDGQTYIKSSKLLTDFTFWTNFWLILSTIFYFKRENSKIRKSHQISLFWFPLIFGQNVGSFWSLPTFAILFWSLVITFGEIKNLQTSKNLYSKTQQNQEIIKI